MFARLGGMFSSDLAVDLGTANTLVFVHGEGIVLNEPSIVSIHQADGSVLAVGREAKAMVGRTPGNIVAVITSEAVEALGLRPGVSASALIKSTSVIVER